MLVCLRERQTIANYTNTDFDYLSIRESQWLVNVLPKHRLIGRRWQQQQRTIGRGSNYDAKRHIADRIHLTPPLCHTNIYHRAAI